MVRSWLALMLVAAQFLSGTGMPLYVCIGSDGTYCCVDTGPEACTCCRPHDEHDACDEACCSELLTLKSTPACTDNHDREESSHRLTWLTGHPCDCTHVLISAEQRTFITRMSSTSDGEQLAMSMAKLPTTTEAMSAIVPPDARSQGPPLIPNFALTVLSTVVFRC
ncbi:MAG: hypothetical protein ACKVT0_07660 [Planctomycetaceae bacterium]